jgi:diaminopimelate epimerase
LNSHNRKSLVPASKFHCYGNDFLIVNSEAVASGSVEEFARALCDPHFGVGADGCVLVEPQSPTFFELRILNQDGSEAGMSGNGARCAAAYIHRSRLADRPDLQFRTTSGEKRYRLVEGSAFRWKYTSEMGKPRFRPGEIPFRAPVELDKVDGFGLAVEGREIEIFALSIGNPQCVVFVESLPEGSEFRKLGEGLSKHPYFPEGTNVSFAQVNGRHDVRIRIWERGVGPTYSSGTGSCGAAIAAVACGSADSPVAVATDTGSQVVEWGEGQEVSLTGEVEFVAEVLFRWESVK